MLDIARAMMIMMIMVTKKKNIWGWGKVTQTKNKLSIFSHQFLSKQKKTECGRCAFHFWKHFNDTLFETSSWDEKPTLKLSFLGASKVTSLILSDYHILHFQSIFGMSNMKICANIGRMTICFIALWRMKCVSLKLLKFQF